MVQDATDNFGSGVRQQNARTSTLLEVNPLLFTEYTVRRSGKSVANPGESRR
jgi:hypothetical protein